MTEGKDPGATATEQQRPAVERRRASLPQPDFSFYKKAEAWPGPKYLFVGHSYNVEIEKEAGEAVARRSDVITNFFKDRAKWVPVGEAVTDERFNSILTRFEHDLLSRLPQTSLVGMAIDTHGNLIDQSFTIWREERRQRRSDSKPE